MQVTIPIMQLVMQAFHSSAVQYLYLKIMHWKSSQAMHFCRSYFNPNTGFGVTACLLFSQPPWPVTRTRWTGAGSTGTALEAVAWSSGTRTDPLWTPVCTVWMRTWPPLPSASTRSPSTAPPTAPLTPPPSTSCPAPTQWQVSEAPPPSLHLRSCDPVAAQTHDMRCLDVKGFELNWPQTTWYWIWITMNGN